MTMDQLKRAAGILWMILGPLAVYYLVHTAAIEIAKNVKVRMLKSSLLKKNEPKKEPAKKEETKEAKS